MLNGIHPKRKIRRHTPQTDDVHTGRENNMIIKEIEVKDIMTKTICPCQILPSIRMSDARTPVNTAMLPS